MGLDITAYANITIAGPDDAPFDETGEVRYDDGWEQFFVNYDFPAQADDIKNGHAYRYQDDKCFHAGSYFGYGQWRNKLAELAGYPESEDSSNQFKHSAYVWEHPELLEQKSPFVELINFTDCDGIIGPKTSAKLAQDFDNYMDKASQVNDEWFFCLYKQWANAFHFAANNGAVKFS